MLPDALTDVCFYAKVLFQTLYFKKCKYMKIIEKHLCDLDAMIQYFMFIKFSDTLQLNMKFEVEVQLSWGFFIFRNNSSKATPFWKVAL